MGLWILESKGAEHVPGRQLKFEADKLLVDNIQEQLATSTIRIDLKLRMALPRA
jgi:hypothetical protein